MYCYMYICRYIPGILCSNPILQLCGNQKLPLSLEKYVYIYICIHVMSLSTIRLRSIWKAFVRGVTSGSGLVEGQLPNM